MIATGVITPFLIPVKVTLLVAFLIACRGCCTRLWAFIAPGLYAHEKKLVAPLVVSSSLLFIVGVAFCYFFVFGVVFSFINNFAPKSISVAPDIDSYFGFVMTMFLAFGMTFEVPIVVIVLVRMGLVTVEKLKHIRPYVIVGAFVIAAVVTPPDIMSQMLLAVPLCLLYEVGPAAGAAVREGDAGAGRNRLRPPAASCALRSQAIRGRRRWKPASSCACSSSGAIRSQRSARGPR